MISKFWPVAFILLSGIPGSFGQEQQPEKRKPLAVADLYRLDSPQAVTLVPEGERAVFVRNWIDPEIKKDCFSLWLAEGSRDKIRPLELGEPDGRAPVLSPDGKWIAFLSNRPRPTGWKSVPPVPLQSDTALDLWLLPLTGGPAVPLAGPDRTFGRVFHDGFYGRLAFDRTGRRLAFIADDGKDPRTPEEIAADVIVVRPDQGEGYTGYGPAQVWVATLRQEPGPFAAERIDRLTDDDVWYGDPQWAPDDKSLVVHANRTKDRESVRFSINKNFDLWALDVESKKLRQLTFGPGPEVSPRFSPDGKRLACLSIPRKGSHRDVFNLALVTLGESGSRTEVLFDHHGPEAEKAPHLPPVYPLPDDCWDGPGHLVYRSEQGVQTSMVRLDLAAKTGNLIQATEGTGDLATVAGRLHRRGQLTPPGNRFLAERLLGETEVVIWKNEGLNLEGLLTVPPRVVAAPPYKLIVYPHGGPHSRSALGFDFMVQIFAANGYAVFQPNFRGSSGYGQRFTDADRFDLGGGDMRDVLTGIDHLVSQKRVNPDQQFVFGSSYGGYLTTWLVGHTRQFRAAVAQNAVTDLNFMWGLSDLQSWTEWEFGGPPWLVPGAMRQHSPFSWVANVETPTLILHARDDRRVPLPMGQLFYQGLRARGVPTEMVIYPGEGHGIRQPRHREDVLGRILAWFAQHEKK